MTERKTGTREWAKHNLNIAKGCSNACRYCYARQNALRFKRIASVDEWPTMVVDKARVNKRYGKRKNDDPDVYDIMFPTSHDITPPILDDCITVLEKVLEAGNKVLIVTKPDAECVEAMLVALSPWRDQVTYRFTIGADDDAILSYWEPNAPCFADRLYCLEIAHEDGVRTSVSIEPMLDPANIDSLVKTLLPFVTETIWIGKGNKMRLRCPDVDDHMLTALEEAYTDDKILEIVSRWGSNPKIRWKDSIKLVIEAHDGQ